MTDFFEQLKRNICEKVMEKEHPEQLAKNAFDTLCLLQRVYGLDIYELEQKWSKGEEV